ncbi:MAG TPA: acyl-CoA dehydrogenase family protein [Polyangiales bacterium]|nr:acyl-CoA dehydrogenase family protein [Polyangiales bacterium]
MTDSQPSTPRFLDIARRLGPSFARRAAGHDAAGSFVSDNYAQLKESRLFSAGVPAELGGGGATHAELCEMLRELARHCGSTALALSMHTHLVAAAVWRHRHGQPAEALLRKVAASELVLVSTGAGDWVDSVGRAERVPGGYKVTARKRFASGSPAGDLIMTTAPFDDPERGAEVLHFAVSLRAEGVRVHDDWDTLGMRGTGSHTVELDGVFVPEEAISLRRARGRWHPSWNVVMAVAVPIFMSAYVGIAERAGELARDAARGRAPDPIALQSLGELENLLATARMGLRELIENANGFDFEPVVERGNRALIHKTITANAVLASVDKALELVGGGGLFRRNELERLLRDIKGVSFHPLPEKKQLDFTGRVALGLDPISG